MFLLFESWSHDERLQIQIEMWHKRLFASSPSATSLRPPPPTPPLSSATSALASDSIMPVVRVKFKSANGRVQEGIVLIDIGTGITVIQKDFARVLGHQGQLEMIDIAVVGGERITQSNSKGLNFGFPH